MIKKILLTLLILIVIISTGIVALVIFVEPNNFRGFISETVKSKTGYELTIEGDLRWHIWPQISILTDSIRLEDEGAKTPILTADNMRLDVELFPLFSKELAVKNVLVKAAVINITDKSKGKVATGNQPTTTVNQTQSPTSSDEPSSSGWSFSLNKLEIVDSTVVLQQDKDIISFRDIDASVVQKDEHNIAVNLSGAVNRNQQDFIYSLDANANLAKFPQQAIIDLHKFTYKYTGIGVPAGELKGEVTATLNYQKSPLLLESNNLSFTLNGNQFNGQIKADLDKKPYIEAMFKSDKFDLTPFLSNTTATESSASPQTQKEPVVSTKVVKGNELSFLQDFNAKFNLTINEVTANKVVVNNFIIDGKNDDGIATLNKVNLDIAQGHITANGAANGKQAATSIKLTGKAADIDLGILFAQLELANHFKGQFNANGDIATNTIVPDRIMNALTGDVAVLVSNARLENLNIQQIIQLGISQYAQKSVTSEEYQKYTEFHELSANAKIAKGDMMLSSLKALSATLDIVGNGRIGLVKQDIDVDLQVKMLSGWNEHSETIQKLQGIAIPLRIYGSFNELHYQLNAEKVIKEVLGNKLQNELDRLKERLGGKNSTGKDESDSSNSSKEKTIVKDVLGGLLNKTKQ